MNAFHDPHREDLQDQLTDLYRQVPPPPHELRPGRQRFLDEAARLRAQAARPVGLVARWRQRAIQPAFRFASLTLVAIVALVALSGGLVHLAEASLPGELLYPLKLAYEDLRLSLTYDPTVGAERNLTYASERVNEMQELTAQGSTIPDQLVDRLVLQMDRALEQAASAPPADTSLLMEQFRLTMTFQRQVLVQIQQEGPDGDQAPVHTALQATERAYDLVESAQGDPKRFQEEWLLHLQPAAPRMGDDEGQPQFEHQNRHQFQQPADAGPPADDRVGPPPVPTPEAKPGSQNQSGQSDGCKPFQTPSPGKTGR